MRIPRPLLLAALWTAAIGLAARPSSPSLARSAQDSYPFARTLDERAGLGTPPSGRALQELFRHPRGANAAWLREILELPTDVEVRLAEVEARYRRLGYFELLPAHTLERERAGLEELGRRFAACESRPFAAARTPAQALGLGRMLLDERYALRAPLLVGLREEIREFRAALNLLEVHTRGLADLETMGLLVPFARRFDLCAARLRCLRTDLDALHESVAAEPEPLPDGLVDALQRGDGVGGTALLRPLREALRARAAAIERSLATPRFDREQREALTRRLDARRQSIAYLREILRLLPELASEDAQAAQGDLSASERHREAVRAARAALEQDPLATELHYVLAIASDFVMGRSSSLPHFDAFLALRGIRHWDESTYARRWLDATERYAMWVVAGWRPPVVEPASADGNK